jgi:hypothetical protein
LFHHPQAWHGPFGERFNGPVSSSSTRTAADQGCGFARANQKKAEPNRLGSKVTQILRNEAIMHQQPISIGNDSAPTPRTRTVVASPAADAELACA